MTLDRRKRFLILLGCALGVAIGFIGFFIYDSLRPPQIYRDVAKNWGLGEIETQRSHNLIDLAHDGKISDKEWIELVIASKHQSPLIRSNAYAAIAMLWNTPFSGKVYQELERMNSDPESEVKDMYIWRIAIARHPQWIQRAKALAASGNPEERRIANDALANVEKWRPR